ncbi:adenylate/guanylate cyclase domain-containing protein [Roseovarius sp. D22-M7]|uniref:adenylate/guanylate cyclase domain-containing protein n=1 Tax=Roseovarius sp. D22-M7 TaxID=3127116 RepID=UPI0030100EBB
MTTKQHFPRTLKRAVKGECRHQRSPLDSTDCKPSLEDVQSFPGARMTSQDQTSVARKLTTIVAIDVAGYSRLVAADKETTLLALTAHRSELIDPLLSRHGGRVANTACDSLLIEFQSAVSAMRCAVAVEAGTTERNGKTPADRQLAFRIGVNIGDVVVSGRDLLGDGVNVAAAWNSRLVNVRACETDLMFS